MTSRLLPLLHRAGALLVLGWLLVGLGREIDRTLDRQVWNPPRGVGPDSWRYGTPQPERLRAFLARALTRLPPASRLAFASEGDHAHSEMFRYLWASYFLVDRVVLPAYHSAARDHGDYWIAYRVRLGEPALEPVYEEPGGAVYRLRREEPRASRAGTPSGDR
jgi:hypothetical protein